MMETHTYDPGKHPLPSVGDWVVVMVTAVVSATHFYVHLPFGAESLLSLQDSSSEAGVLNFCGIFTQHCSVFLCPP